MHPRITFFRIWLFRGEEQPRRGRSRGGEGGGTDKKHLSDKPPLIRCGETYCT